MALTDKVLQLQANGTFKRIADAGVAEIGAGIQSTLGNLTITGQSGFAIVFNDGAANIDVRMEGQTQTHLFFLDASTDSIGLANNTPSSILDIAGALTVRGMAAPALSPATQGRLYFDVGTNKWRISENGSAYQDLLSTGGVTGTGVNNQIAVWSGPSALDGSAGFTWDSVTSAFAADGSVTFNESAANKDLRVEGVTDANLLFIDASTNFIGVGTNTPSQKLHVQDGTLLTAIWSRNTATIGQAYVSALNDASNAVFISSIGSAVVGTYIDTGLNNAGAVELSGSPDVSALLALRTSNTAPIVLAVNNAEHARWTTTAAVFNETAANYDFRVEGVTNPNLLFADASVDRIGIGTATPGQLLHLRRSGTDGLTGIAVENPSLLAGAQSRVDLGPQAITGPSDYLTLAYYGDTNLAALSTLGAGHLALQSRNAAGALYFTTGGLTERMRITPTGNVGINTATPAGRLEVRDDTSTGNLILTKEGVTGANDLLEFRTDAFASLERHTMRWTSGSGAIGLGRYGMEYDSTANTVDFVWRDQFNVVAGTTETMRLKGNGRLGIGTSAPAYSLHVIGSALISGNLTVQGTTTSISSETMLVNDNHLYLNNGYTAVSAQTGGLVVNYLPTATATVVNAAYVAGVPATSNPIVGTIGAATFTVGSFVQFSGGTTPVNNGLFEVLSHAANVLTVRGIGLTGTVEDFTQNQFVAGASDGATITKVNISVIRAGTDGVWEVGQGLVTPLVFTDIGLASSGMAIGNTITSATAGSVLFAGALGVLAQDNPSFTYNSTTNILTVDGVQTVDAGLAFPARGTASVTTLASPLYGATYHPLLLNGGTDQFIEMTHPLYVDRAVIATTNTGLTSQLMAGSSATSGFAAMGDIVAYSDVAQAHLYAQGSTHGSMAGAGVLAFYNNAGPAAAHYVSSKGANRLSFEFETTVSGGLGTHGVEWFATTATETVFNEPGANKDLRVEGDTVADLFFVDASTDCVGIGTTTPTSRFSIGASSEFQVNTTGNIVKLNNVTTSFPAAQGAASTVLTNDGAGNLTWVAAGASMAIGGSITSATAGSVLFAGAAGVLAQDNANFFWDDTNNSLGLGNTSPAALTNTALSVSRDAAAISLFSSFNAVSAATTSTLTIARGRGTYAAPTAVLSGDTIASLFFAGQLDSTLGNIGSGARFRAVALENFAASTRGTTLFLDVANIGGVPNEKASFSGAGIVFNDTAADSDFRVEGFGSRPDLFMVDAGQARVGINRAATTLGSTLDIDNLAVAESIFIARDNGTAVFTIDDGGAVTSTSTSFTIGGAGTMTWPGANASGVLTNNGTGTLTWAAAGGGMAIGGSITSATAGSVLFAGALGVLAQDNANFFWDDTANQLKAANVYVSNDGTALLPSLTLGTTADPNTGFWHPAADTLAASTNGVEHWRISSAGMTTVTADAGTVAFEAFVVGIGAGVRFDPANNNYGFGISGAPGHTMDIQSSANPTTLNLQNNDSGELTRIRLNGGGHQAQISVNTPTSSSGTFPNEIFGWSMGSAAANTYGLGIFNRGQGGTATFPAVISFATGNPGSGNPPTERFHIGEDNDSTIGGNTFNLPLADFDFRVNGTSANLLFGDASTNRVGVKTATPVSSLEVAGSIGFQVTSVATNTTLDATHCTVLVDASGGAITITLPTAASSNRRRYDIKKTDSSGNAITVDANGSETIDGALTWPLAAQYNVVTVVSDGTAWYVI